MIGSTEQGVEEQVKELKVREQDFPDCDVKTRQSQWHD